MPPKAARPQAGPKARTPRASALRYLQVAQAAGERQGCNILDWISARGVGGAKVVAPGMLSALPAPAELERRCRALAVLDAVLCPDPRWRYYSFDQASRPGERVARMEAATVTDG